MLGGAVFLHAYDVFPVRNFPQRHYHLYSGFLLTSFPRQVNLVQIT
jgi:hypothetical protein